MTASTRPPRFGWGPLVVPVCPRCDSRNVDYVGAKVRRPSRFSGVVRDAWPVVCRCGYAWQTLKAPSFGKE
ncbi:MAG: hypothetical protein ACRDGM_17965 [bacterium]